MPDKLDAYLDPGRIADGFPEENKPIPEDLSLIIREFLNETGGIGITPRVRTFKIWIFGLEGRDWTGV